MWSLDIDLARPTSNLHPTINITFTRSSGNVSSKSSIWHIHIFGLKQDFYGWMPFLTLRLIKSTGKLGVFFPETPSLRWQNLEILVPDKPKNQNLDTAEGIYHPLSVPEWTFCQKQVHHVQAFQQDLRLVTLSSHV